MRTRRSTELLLLIAAALPVLLVFVLAQVEAEQALTLSDLLVPGALLAAFAVAHAVTRLRAPDADPVLLPVAALLAGIGVTFVTRLEPELGGAQAVWVLAGVAAFAVTLYAVPSLERLARYKYTVMLAGLGLLLLPAVIGVEVNGAKLWLRFAGFSFQPAEVAKILIVLFLAAYLAERREVLSVSTRKVLGVWLPPARHLAPLVGMWAVSLVVLVAEKDLGSSLLFFGIFVVMLMVASGRVAYGIAGVGLFSAGAYAAYRIFGHVQDRIAIWLDPFADAQGTGFQLVQSLFALAAGGMAGVGIGKGFPDRIPFVETDFIFSAIAEELGLLGGAALIVAYLVFCMRGLSTASRARSDMAALTATGLVAAFALQTFVIIGGVTRLIPLTGITLPFVSYGGSSIVSNFILLALLLRAGDAPRAQAAAEKTDDRLSRRALVRRLSWTTALVGLLLTALVVNLTYVQVVAAEDLRAHTENTRALASEIRSERGVILTSDGVVLASSELVGEIYERRYPQGDLAAHVLGYYSPRFGRSGIEAAMNEVLTGRREFSDLAGAIDAAAGVPVPGNDVYLTIDSVVQAAAQDALAGKTGAIAAIDPRTGAVLALASTPSYDPAEVEAAFNVALADAADGEGYSSATDPAPLVHRAATSLYPPGSTYKVVTLTAYLAQAGNSPADTYSGRSPMEIGNAPVRNYAGSSYGSVTVERATLSSINTVYAQMAVDLGAEAMVAQSNAMGFGEEPPLEIPTTASLMPLPELVTTWELAWMGAGQPVGMHEGPIGPSVTPLQMALVAAAIAGDGELMEPHLVAKVTDHGGLVLDEADPRTWRTACTPQTAQVVTDILEKNVQAGTGTRAQIPGVRVAGKTGTAEIGDDLPTHAWFVCFAPVEDPVVAVAVLVEGGGTGGRGAAPLAKLVLEAALSSSE